MQQQDRDVNFIPVLQRLAKFPSYLTIEHACSVPEHLPLYSLINCSIILQESLCPVDVVHGWFAETEPVLATFKWFFAMVAFVILEYKYSLESGYDVPGLELP